MILNKFNRPTFAGRVLAGFFLILLSVTSASAQNERFRLSKPEMTVGQAVTEIEAQTNYKFAFDNAAFDRSAKVKFTSTELTVGDALVQMFSGTGFDFIMRNRLIAVVAAKRAETGQPAGAAARKSSRYGDTYRRSDMGSLNSTGRRKPAALPRIEIVDTTTVRRDIVRSDDAPSFTSHNISANSYIPSKLSMVSIKTNLLYAAGTLTPNLALEFGVAKRSTIEISGSWNQWNYKGDKESNRKLNHYIVRPEYRYWFCERFTRHFIGADMFFSQFNISEYGIPLVNFKKENRYEGHAWGGGIVYGYHLPIAKRWGVEFHVGIGVAQMEYRKYACRVCVQEYETVTKTYFGPTRAGINLVFMIK